MSVYKRGSVFWVEFVYRGLRHRQSTGQIDREAALAVERHLKDQARQQAHGVAIPVKRETPRLQDWAEVYCEDAAKRDVRIDRIEDLLRGVLRFWGAAPADPTRRYPGAPYHDLRLGDVVADPSWLLRWETWLSEPKRDPTDKAGVRTRLWSGQTKNQHRSMLSQLFAMAIKPAWRGLTGVTENPCVGMDRDRRVRRTAVLSREDLLAIIGHASYHLRVAIALALLTPKLREGDILRLEFGRDFSEDLQWLTVHGHKTEGRTGKPLVAHVPAQLREILLDAKRRAGRRSRVITYQRRPVAELRGAVAGAVRRAAVDRPHLVYGRSQDHGITFHTLRHAASTLLAELGVPLVLHRNLVGHERIETTLGYTHLRPMDEVAAAEQLSATLPIKDLVMAPRSRPPRPVGETVGTPPAPRAKTGANPRAATTARKRRKAS